MKTKTSHTWQGFVNSSTLTVIGFTCIASVAYALPEPAATEINPADSQGEVTQPVPTPFNYLIENRADPFVPFISEKSSTGNINEIVPVAEQLSGMQLFEPGQLNLVAIVIAENSDFAMAEDTTGMGYILLTGMKIGKRGTIIAIHKNEVVIEETAFTKIGKKLTSKIVMLLKKEGEE